MEGAIFVRSHLNEVVQQNKKRLNGWICQVLFLIGYCHHSVIAITSYSAQSDPIKPGVGKVRPAAQIRFLVRTAEYFLYA